MFWEGLWNCLELGATKVVECLRFSELFCVLLDKNAKRGAVGGGLIC